jgi:hypothetical protein
MGVVSPVQHLVVTTTNRRLWRVSDVFMVASYSGAGRWAITGVSSKGRRISGYWVGLKRWPGLNHRKDVDIFEVPGGDAGMLLSDPDLRRFAESIAGGVSAICDPHAEAPGLLSRLVCPSIQRKRQQ